MLETLTAVLILFGAAFVLVGSLGLLRLPDFYTRLHAPTKATTLGLAGLLGAATLHSAMRDAFTPRDFLITFFLFITAPVSAHILARAAIRRRISSLVRLPDSLRRESSEE